MNPVLIRLDYVMSIKQKLTITNKTKTDEKDIDYFSIYYYATGTDGPAKQH
jgi:hypothetical protein